MKTLQIWIIFALIVTLPAAGVCAENKMIRPGDPFPELQLFTPDDFLDRVYLQLKAHKTFSPSQIKTDLLVIEMLNVHCLHCQMQAPAYNELHKLIESEDSTRGKIKLLGLAVGNLDWEVAEFREKYAIDFPILADANFAAWRATGGSTTPLTFYVRQTEPGKPGILIGLHRGLNTHYEGLYETLAELAQKDPQALIRETRAVIAKQQSVKPIMSDEELEFRVRTAFTRFGLIKDFARMTLLSGRQVYTARVSKELQEQRLFAEVTSRPSVCDVCHDIHFFYLFDRTTKIISFEPLHLTKYGNVNWSPEDIDRMRKRVIGKHLSMPQPFDPKLDAVSSATITSAIIFDSLAQGEDLIRELRAQGML